MQRAGWWQQALESAVQEASVVEDKIGLARMAILERLVAPAATDRESENELIQALDELRALDWERLAQTQPHFATLQRARGKARRARDAQSSETSSSISIFAAGL